MRRGEIFGGTNEEEGGIRKWVGWLFIDGTEHRLQGVMTDEDKCGWIGTANIFVIRSVMHVHVF